MLRLSKKVDYGLMAITHIAERPHDGNINSKHIAEEYNIPQELLAKILQKLAREGLIASRYGPKGGYFLVKDPHEITVREVISAIEGPIALVDCSSGKDCAQFDHCHLRGPIEKIQNSIYKLLDGIAIDEISNQVVSIGR